jgi:HEPN domain-containing protein
LVSATGLVWLIIAGVVLLFIANGLKPRKIPAANNPTRRRRAPPQVDSFTYGALAYPPPRYRPPEYYLWRLHTGIPQRHPRSIAAELRRRALLNGHLQRALGAQTNVKALHQAWRRSIAGLLSLAETHLGSAKRKVRLRFYEEAIDDAATSVENIARAVLYCYGDKPNLSSGQGEPLQILAARLNGPEKITLEKIIENVAVINHNRIALKRLETRELKAKLFDSPSARELIERASSVVNALQQIINDRFRLEIPELTTQGERPS